jgi:pimeloyl-ACP methyl ester carboxylesterase
VVEDVVQDGRALAESDEAVAHEAPEAAVMAASQRPIALSAGTETSGPAAWKSIPSWALVATADRAIGTSNVRFMARRAGARIVEVAASHAVPVSQPDDVAALVVAAARSVS